ncbi:dTDP-4-dehydrorhamnose 3,5-epimerase [Enemella evansiae]|uniref:dTDP-4-dehydrorhamnose 3,5-epimerase family protein n=1 Tax=Enemella evansiae TaxID=2016499 RepID=UPI000B96C59E|nr:dTDP-4-dehydrorhamnose 3,5-epimerase family protein [Enemella evansiae]OYO15488.1 dTDP-4-dehydrorhamnose 3,5-epimerase [Enemella evansiae]
MRITPSIIPGALHIIHPTIADERGFFGEVLRWDALETVLERPFTPRQMNTSTSHKGVLRGIHLVQNPPGQEKFVTCLAGAVLDVLIDCRPNSPTFGDYEARELAAGSGEGVLIPDGVGHAFFALKEGSVVQYLLDRPHVPGTQIDLNPLDPHLGIRWPVSTTAMKISPKDATAPTLLQAQEAGLLTAVSSPAPHDEVTQRRNRPDAGASAGQ